MFLRYYLNDKGERVYTFKVFYFYLLFSMSLMTERRPYVLILRDSPPMINSPKKESHCKKDSISFSLITLTSSSNKKYIYLLI